jgi:hypothetical protein
MWGEPSDGLNLKNSFDGVCSDFGSDSNLVLAISRERKLASALDSTIAIVWEPDEGPYEREDWAKIEAFLSSFVRQGTRCFIAAHRHTEPTVRKSQIEKIRQLARIAAIQLWVAEDGYSHGDQLYSDCCSAISAVTPETFDQVFEILTRHFGIDAYGPAHRILLRLLPDYIAGRSLDQALPGSDAEWEALAHALGKSDVKQRVQEHLQANIRSGNDWYKRLCQAMLSEISHSP